VAALTAIKVSGLQVLPFVLCTKDYHQIAALHVASVMVRCFLFSFTITVVLS
jgi:hypothetical protein